MIRETPAAVDAQVRQVAVGLALCVVVAVADIVSPNSVVLIPLLAFAPVITSGWASTRATTLVAVAAVATAVALGWADAAAGSARHVVGIAATVIGGVVAVWIAATRQRRTRELLLSQPKVERADRLKATLATGRMGEWTWDRTTNEVAWDANIAVVFGIEDGQFGGTFDSWLAIVHEDDREMVERAVGGGVAQREPFRFDHRVVWPDGSVHWVEGIGDVIIGPDDEVVGGFGLAIDVDDRHREVEERTRLLEVERRARARVEYLDKVHDVLSTSLDVVEIVGRVTHSVIPELAEWCSILVSIDRPRDRPLLTVAHSDPDKIRWAEQVVREHPYDPDAGWGAAGVIHSGRREVIRSVDPAVYSAPGGDVLAEAGLRSVVTVPITGALGILGAMQLIRGGEQLPFAPADIELIEELAGRVGAALNTAVLFDRQIRSRAALDTLQQVSGRIAAVATTNEIVQAVIVHGSAGIRADGAAMFLRNEDGELTVAQSTHRNGQAEWRAERVLAQQALDDGAVVVRSMAQLAEGAAAGTALGVPLRIMSQVVGSLVFTFDDEREFTSEELSMFFTLGSRCAGALERASLYERERDIALTFQHRLLSSVPPTPEWIDVASRYLAATGMEIGGDWYQVLEADNGRIVAVVGDAVGHGLSAAAAMGQLRASIATAVANDAEPDRALAAVDLFAKRGADTLGASVAYALFERDGRCRYASAGHIPTIWMSQGGPAELMERGRRPLLGFRNADDLNVTDDVRFTQGDTVVMFTDGLFERRGEALDAGLERLLRAVEQNRHLSPDEMCDALIDHFADSDVDDDIALLVLRHT